MLRTIRHTVSELSRFDEVTDQYDFRKELVLDELRRMDINYPFEAVIGRGGIGGCLIELLARIGVGYIRTVDGDVFEESNFNRQLLSEQPLMGRSKAKAAQEKIKLGVTKEEYIPAYEVQSELARLLANDKKSLLAMGHNIASDLAGLGQETAAVAKNEVDKRINEAL